MRGLLCAAYKTPNAFAAEELNFAEAVASVLSTALQRIDSENRLAYLAQFDPLTGLANRTLLADRFSQIIVQAKRRDVPLATLFIDLDGFKTVNDTLGHAGGDELLKEVALRLQPRCATATRWRASAATSSPSCSPTWRTSRMRRWSRRR